MREALAALRVSPDDTLAEQQNNAADLIRRLLGYEDEPDESTVALIYAAIEGDAAAFQEVAALAAARGDAPAAEETP